MNVQELLIFNREKAGFTQSELAEKMKLSRQSISKWENGINFPDIENLMLLSDLYNISIDELVRGSSCFPKPYRVREAQMTSKVGYVLLSLYIFTAFIIFINVVDGLNQLQKLLVVALLIPVIILIIKSMRGYWVIDRDGLFIKEQVYPSAIQATSNAAPKFYRLKGKFLPYKNIRSIEIVYQKWRTVAPSTPDFYYIKVVEDSGRIISLGMTPDLQTKLPQLWGFFEKKNITLIDENEILYAINEKEYLYNYMRGKK